MNYTESISRLRNIVENHSIDTNIIVEAAGHLDHPEDLVFLDGSAGARRAIDAIKATAQHPQSITIKWDGYPALIFGRDRNRRFSIMDKHMFNRKDGQGRKVYSPEDFMRYDQERDVDRSQLHQIIQKIWRGLESSTSVPGYYWGDLLFSNPLKPEGDIYKFRANPNGITYTVEVDSEMGKFLAGKVAGIVVHQYLSPDAATTDNASPLDGGIGPLKNNSNVAIVPAKMPLTPKIKLDTKLVSAANSSISKYGNSIDTLLNTAPQAKSAFSGLFTTYINRRIVSGNLDNLVDGFVQYYRDKPMTQSMRGKLDQHFASNKNGIVGMFAVWIAIYNLKMSVVDQLNRAAETSPVKGYLQSGVQTQEGFVSQGLKFVDRMGFSRQNLAGR